MLLVVTPVFCLGTSLVVSLQDVLDSLEFARGNADSTWGSVRAAMGHPEPFPVKYVAIGNEDCGKKFYRGTFLNYFLILSLHHITA